MTARVNPEAIDSESAIMAHSPAIKIAPPAKSVIFGIYMA